jgi:DNA-binding SARP family transcriptional activator
VRHYSDLEDVEQELRLAYVARQHGDAEGALAHFSRAFALRRSELLPEFRYDDWAADEVAEERDKYLGALEEAAQLHGTRGEQSRAIELLKRAAREDPLRESSALQLMEWLWRRGDQSEALRVYVRLRGLLASRLQLEPGPRLTALYHAIERDRSTGGPHGPGRSAAS